MSDQATYSILRYEGAGLPDQYRALVYSKWLRSLRHGNDFFKLIDSEAYYRAYPPVIESILGKPDCVIRLAALTDDVDVVLGFSVCRGAILDYVNVQKDHRGAAIATHLIPDNIEQFTHITKTWLRVWSTARFNHFKFNPFA